MEQSALSSFYKEALRLVEQGKRAQLVTRFTGESGSVSNDLTRVAREMDESAILQGNVLAPSLEKDGPHTVFTEPVTPRERLILLGGGHVALPLCEFSARVGFDVTVVDDRPSFCNAARFPWAKHTVCDSFQNAIEALSVSACDFVVVITRGHRYDAECLRALFKKAPTAYLGMIGSRRRVRGLLDMLLEEGFPKERLEAVCTPIGLKIGAVTPEEISISILAELISYKRLPEKAALNGAYVNGSDLEPDVLGFLAHDEAPKTVVTVLKTRGSTPRGAGAKMAVDASLRITGSIGGGCAEGTVIREAVRLIGTGQYLVLRVDMTGAVAEDEGMVCGGVMDVLIEDAR